MTALEAWRRSAAPENVPMEGDDRGAFYGVHRSVVRVVPHLARLVDRAPSDSGPLLGAP